MQTQVSIAFRRSALRLRKSNGTDTTAGSESPLPFGVLPSGYRHEKDGSYYTTTMSPLPFGVLPSGYPGC